MSKLAGVKIEKDTQGRTKRVTFDMKQHKIFLEDYLDHLEIVSAVNEPTIPWEDAVKKLDKKHKAQK